MPGAFSFSKAFRAVFLRSPNAGLRVLGDSRAMEPSPGRGSISPAAARDSGLRRASALTRWIGVGAVALVGALAGFLAQAKPGRSTATSQHLVGAAPSAPQPDPSTPSGGSNGGAAPPSLAAPLAPPAPAPSSSGIVSGGS
jgi:hypothetical protein